MFSFVVVFVTFQIQTGQGDGTPVHTIQAISESGSQGEVVDLNSVTEATLNSEGQIILTGEDGHGE
jgi:nuclear respiratory factor 1